MNKKLVGLSLVLCFVLNFSIVSANVIINNDRKFDDKIIKHNFSEEYGIQWVMNFGPDRRYGARYEGPQPIGDCDNDGLNEVLVGGRDGRLRVFEWDEEMQTYLEMHTLHCPFYPFENFDAGGFAIGDLTGDGKNEIGLSWSTTIHKWKSGKYKILGYNNWRFANGGGSADCYIGDYDNDGENELIQSGGPMHEGSKVPEIGIYKWNGLRVVKEAEWDISSSGYTFVYMPGVGDIDEDGKNEIVLGSAYKVIVLDWNENNKEFDQTVIKTTGQHYYPFACVLKDSDMDGKNEIHVGYSSPLFIIFEWNGEAYEIKYEKEWYGEGSIIEGVDVGDVDGDGIAEVCVGTDVVHILQWNGTTYVEEAVLQTFGDLAVVSIGDCDNDGINEINAGSVMKEHNQDFMYWIYKYGMQNKKSSVSTQTGSLKVDVKTSFLGIPLKNASVAAWNNDTKIWYDIQARSPSFSTYTRNDLPEGEYLLRVKMEGYQIKETQITIQEGEETTHTFILGLKTASRESSCNKPLSNLLLILEKIISNYPVLARLLQI
jgi:hypothetical protein